MTTEETLQDAIAAIKTGDKQRGREIIAQILKTDRENEQAWLWLTQTNITYEEKIKSLQNVLKINPDNKIANEGLAKLQAARPQQQPPPEPEPKPKPKPPHTLLKSQFSKESVNVATSPPDTKQCPYCAEIIKAEARICRFCGNDLTPDAPSPVKEQPRPKRTSKIWSVIGFVIMATLLACVLCAFAGSMLDDSPVTSTAVPTQTSYFVWVDGFENCPSHPDFGEQIVNQANTWTEDGNARFIYIPHGTRVEVLSEHPDGFYRIRWNGETTYIQTIMTQPQDPSLGVVPKQEDCLF